MTACGSSISRPLVARGGSPPSDLGSEPTDFGRWRSVEACRASDASVDCDDAEDAAHVGAIASRRRGVGDVV